MATRAGRDAGNRRVAHQQHRRPSGRPAERAIAALEKAARSVEAAVGRGRVTVATRETFQAVALLVRELRERTTEENLSEVQRAARLNRINAIATVLAKTAARDGSLLALLTGNTRNTAPFDRPSTALRELRRATGLEAPAEQVAPKPDSPSARSERSVVPQSVISRRLANPFLPPDFSTPPPPKPQTAGLSSWELLGPLLRSFESASAGAPSSMALPPAPSGPNGQAGPALMPHQAQVVAAAAAGHRTFLLADEPGLGKTAQALLAAQAANAYPLLAVVPNVVKTSWAREAEIWTPGHRATVIHGDGETVDAFSDIVVVNYDVLDRHINWLGTHGFCGMVVDEAHFIKNKTSQRSTNVLDLADRIRSRTMRPLLMALTGTPLINDIEDFLAIWQFLGWIGNKEPGPALMEALEHIDLSPADPDFYPAARMAVIDLGIVRRRKLDVAADIPPRRIADLPVEIEGALGKSIREAERALARRLVQRYRSAIAARSDGNVSDSIDRALVRQVAEWERRDAKEATGEGNVFSLMRRIGRAKAVLAADFTAQLSHNVGKVVFFAKHVEVMDAAEQTFARRGIGYCSIRGDQTARVRQSNIDAFLNDDTVAVAVCSLTAAGVGLNLQVASNVVLAELSWTAAEQTQAIDRVHRIGQDQPVTAWRVLAAQTVDIRIAELIDSKASLAARALDGAGDQSFSTVDVQLEALITLLTDALTQAPGS